MFKFLIFILLIGFFGFLILGVFLGRAIRFFGPTSERAKSNRRQAGNKETKNNTPQKKFSEKEGEYVNYEEVKDE